MPLPTVSIQSFHSSPSKPSPGDGFTSLEVASAPQPTNPLPQWIPQHDYAEYDIGRLQPGPKYVTFVGRVVNIYDIAKPSKKSNAAQGCLKLMLGDDTGAITIRLWYSSLTYAPQLGQLTTIYAVHISSGESSSLSPSSAPLFTSIFPERERSCHISFHTVSDTGTLCKRPFNCRPPSAPAGLLTLQSFSSGGYDIEDCKVIFCVKSIGARKKFVNKAGSTTETLTLSVFDDTAEATLTLYGATCASGALWNPSNTVLLLTNPGWRIEKVARLSLSANTRVDVDPDLVDTRWLRNLAQRLTKREHVNPEFPGSGIFDGAQDAAVRILYSLADVDEWTRASPTESFTGYMSLVITQMHIMLNYKRNMLMSTECCGKPVFANAVVTECPRCNKIVKLRINPRIVGNVIDETGMVACGKIVFSDEAWEQLLGRTAEQFVAMDRESLEYLDQRLVFLRVSVGFGWVGDRNGGRICAWGVRM
ncbi:hypothetical protein B0J11DRAFT_497343 [Dendryphion nanum]|uniref:Nucleic acid-binding protein n=1 Tax=Dendryphion nanum TaxID=256645 RepID=A0A9P9D7K0_9PLEO|nr:hypothetical protein B0J11DRAFT_497343 [Dendryphion nanum]